ncbi:MAG: YncE family protein [Leptospirales bacterium]
MTFQKRFLLQCLAFSLLPVLSGCGGGGGGAGGSGGPVEIAYVLTEDTGAPHAGYVVEYGLNPSSNQFQEFVGGPISTGGDTPYQLLFSPGNSLAFVLNNSDGGSSGTGSVSVFSNSTNGLSTSSTSTQPTGDNPVNMAVDPGGTYLIVANHGNGSSTGTGSVEVFSYTSSGILTLQPSSASPCRYPFRVVFQPGTNGSQSDIADIVCSSPELLTTTTPPPIKIFACTISELEANSCTSPINLPTSLTTSSSALINFTFDPSGQYALGPAITYNGGNFIGDLLVCTYSASTLESCNSPSLNGNSPSGNIAFLESGSSKTVYIGNYNSSNFVACNLPTPSCTSPYSVSPSGPIALAVNPASSSLFVAASNTSSANTYSNTGTISPGSGTSPGSLFSCAIASLSSTTPPCASQKPTGEWPVGITIDPNGTYLFVPTLSGEVDIFSGVASGNLTSFQTLQTTPYTPISVAVPAS